jgi:hypothetical protein
MTRHGLARSFHLLHVYVAAVLSPHRQKTASGEIRLINFSNLKCRRGPGSHRDWALYQYSAEILNLNFFRSADSPTAKPPRKGSFPPNRGERSSVAEGIIMP